MKELLDFLSQHIFTIHLEMGFVPTQQEAPAPDNVIDMRAYNELKNECPEVYEPDPQYDDRLTPMFGFSVK